MIYSLHGTLLEKDIGFAVVECAGVGYQVSITGRCLSALPEKNQPVRLFTYMNVKEDSVELFAFAEPKERDAFKMLIGVSGVGPKMALSILSELSPEDLAVSIVAGDQARITRANGVGAKLASRVILELKDKVQKEMPELLNAKAAAPVEAGQAAKTAEVINALMVLGYTQHEAKRAAAGLDMANLTVEQAIKTALAQIME